MGPAFKGYDEWAYSMRFQPERPAQRMMWIHDQWGITFNVG